MRIATWNVNSIKARLDNVQEWLRTADVDVLLLQEIKCETEGFPRLEFETLGYQALVAGQKAYHGVALLSRLPMEPKLDHLPGDAEDAQARYVEADVQGIRIASLYLPNGNPIATEKYTYKLNWMRRLADHAKELLREETPVVLGGDYNAIPSAEDVWDPTGWEQDALFHPRTRAAFRELIHAGYIEAFRALHPHQKHAFSFWDYQAGCWQQDKGLRIDHLLLSPEATDRMTRCYIDRTPRGQEKASDHTPVVMQLA